MIYTDEAPKEELFEALNELISRFIRELFTREEDREDGVDES